MKTKVMLAALLALALVPVAIAADDPASDESKVAAKELEVQETMLQKGGAAAAGVRVRMDGSTAILTGTVRTQAALELADEVALSVEGVKKVDNRLKLESGKPGRTAEQEMEDSWLEAKVKRHLYSDIGTRARHLEIEVVDGVVSVRGELDSAVRHDLAVASVRQTEGVKKLVDLIKVTEGKH